MIGGAVIGRDSDGVQGEEQKEAGQGFTNINKHVEGYRFDNVLKTPVTTTKAPKYHLKFQRSPVKTQGTGN